MKIKGNKLIAVASLCAILVFPGNSHASGLIEDVKERYDIASGVQYVEIDRFTESGFIDIDILKLDTNNGFSNLTPLVGPNGVSKRATLTTMIDSTDKTVAGINGDFFEVTNFPMALGSLVGDGQVVLTTPESAFSRNSFYLTKDKKGGVGNLNNDINISINGKNIAVNALNKLSRPYKALSILDTNWGPTSPGRNLGANTTEVLVSNGRVVDKRISGLPINITPGSFVLVQGGDGLNNVNIGDRVDINYGSYKNLMFSIGGGNILVNKGAVPNNLPTGRSPRTAIGINKANTEILLVTVDGRNNSSIGMGEKELAEFMKSIGAYYALNLDGGGSTTMGIKYSGTDKSQVVNDPSDGSQRPVVSGVGIKSSAPVSEPSYIKIKPSDTSMFSGFAYPFTVEVFDKHHNKLNVNPAEINITSDFGSISNGNFTPNKKGHGSIKASYKNASGLQEVFIHSEIKEVKLDVDYLQLTNGKTHIFETIYGKDDMGYKKKLSASNFTFSASEGIGRFEGNKFIAEGTGTGTITANYYGIKRLIPVSIGSQKENIFDFNNKDIISVSTKPSDDTKITSNAYIDTDNKDSNPSTSLIYSLAPYDKNQVAELNFMDGIDLKSSEYIGLWIKGNGQNDKITVTFRDGNGKTATTDLVAKVDFSDWKYIEAFIPGSLKGNIFLDKISVIVSESRSGVSTLTFDGLVSSVKLPIDWELGKGSSVAGDPRNYNVDDESAQEFSITSLNKNGNNGSKIAHLNNKDISVIFNGASKETLASINSPMKFNGNDVHNIKTPGNTAFITLQINEYGIRSANPSQWKPFISALENESLKNIVIMLQRHPDSIKGQREKEFFYDTIDEGVKNNKTIFIVSPGDRDSVEYVNGYRDVRLSSYGNSVLDLKLRNENLAYTLTRMN